MPRRHDAADGLEVAGYAGAVEDRVGIGRRSRDNPDVVDDLRKVQ